MDQPEVLSHIVAKPAFVEDHQDKNWSEIPDTRHYYQNSYETIEGPSGPAKAGHSEYQRVDSIPVTPNASPPQFSSGAVHAQQEMYQQKMRDIACDPYRRSKSACDATDTSSCSRCRMRKTKCQSTKESNRQRIKRASRQNKDLETKAMSSSRVSANDRFDNVPFDDGLASLAPSASSSTPTAPIGTSMGGRTLEKQEAVEAFGQNAPLGLPFRLMVILECPFYFLNCSLTFTNRNEWIEHSLQHFGVVGPPKTSKCCFCEIHFRRNSGSQSWTERMDHVLYHHRLGLRLATRMTVLPDFELYDYLWTKRLITPAHYKDLMSGDQQRKADRAQLPQHLDHIGRDLMSFRSIEMESANARRGYYTDPPRPRPRPLLPLIEPLPPLQAPSPSKATYPVLSSGATHYNKSAQGPDTRSSSHALASGDTTSRPEPRKRTKCGCLTCRKRRIKCDETRPGCTNCIKSKRLCEGYAPRLTFKDPLPPLSNKPPSNPYQTSLSTGSINDFKLLNAFTHTVPTPSKSEDQIQQKLKENSEVLVQYQSQIRGALLRRNLKRRMQNLYDLEEKLLDLQARIRGQHARKTSKYRLEIKLSAVHLQSVARGYLVRSRENAKRDGWNGHKKEVIDVQNILRTRESERQPGAVLIARAMLSTKKASQKFQAALSKRFFIPKVEPGKTRIKWTCRCGYESYDDFVELKPGALHEYQKSLKQHNNTQQQQNTSAFRWTVSGISALASLVGLSHGKKDKDRLLPQHEVPLDRHNPTHPSVTTPPDILFLLVCMPHRRYATKLLHLDVRSISSDQAFFSLLNSSYHSMRGRFRSSLSLKTIRAIKFVQFELFRSSLADIRKENDLPPESRRTEYRYDPCPPDFIPPIGENHMMHLYQHPEDAEASGICMKRIPKKLKERLSVCPTKGTGLGWGVHFVESWHYNVIWILGFGTLLAASMVFLVCWAVLKHDVQGASGVAAYMLAFVTLLVGTVQAGLEMTS